MSFTGMYAHLAGTAGVTALAGLRIYPSVLPQHADYPAITFDQVSGVRALTMGGLGGTGLASPRIQITCWATTLLAAKQLGDAVRVATDGFTGTMGSDTVQGVLMENELDTEDIEPGSGRAFYGVIQDYTIWATESTS